MMLIGLSLLWVDGVGRGLRGVGASLQSRRLLSCGNALRLGGALGEIGAALLQTGFGVGLGLLTARLGLSGLLGGATVALDGVLALARGDLVLEPCALGLVLGPLGCELSLGLGLGRALCRHLRVGLGLDLGLLKAALTGEILVADHGSGGLLETPGDLAGEAAAGRLGCVGIRHVVAPV
jgi:hypothetical protein